VMEDGDSCDLEVVAELINMCKFEKVVLYDVHSDVAKALIKNSVNISNKVLVDAYNKPDSILICPDAGAVKKVGKYLEWNKNIVDVVYCTKTRDLSNGKIDLKVLEPEKCTGKNCVIIDDLCDGGGTFVGIASQIKPAFLTLIVTHGIFSKGFKTLSEHDINHIITSDSYRFTNSNSFFGIIFHLFFSIIRFDNILFIDIIIIYNNLHIIIYNNLHIIIYNNNNGAKIS